MQKVLVFLMLGLISSASFAKSTAQLDCIGEKVWIKIWNSGKNVMATANYIGQGSSRFGNLFGPEYLRDKAGKEGKLLESVDQLKKIKVGVGEELWYKVYTIDLGKKTFTYAQKDKTLVEDKILSCK